DIDHEQNDMGDVKLPDSFEQPCCTDDETAVEHHVGVDERSSVAGNENEQVGGVAEPVVARRDPIDGVIWNMIEENRPVGDAAKQVKTEVAAFGRQGCVDVHDGRSRYGFKWNESCRQVRSCRDCHKPMDGL